MLIIDILIFIGIPLLMASIHPVLGLIVLVGGLLMGRALSSH